MKKLITTLKSISIGLGIVSIFFIFYSILTLLKFDSSIDFTKTVDSIYSALATYSGLYKFTLVVWAFWATIHRLQISQDNYQSSLNQMAFVQADIVNKQNKEINNETLKQCNYYLQELQVEYQKLIESNIISGMPIEWRRLSSLTSPSLNKKYPTIYKRINDTERKQKNQILITLYKLEAFSSLFIYGNLDSKLAKKIIGYTFSKQVGFLFGLISYFREDTNSVFGKNTIKLYNEWKIHEEIK